LLKRKGAQDERKNGRARNDHRGRRGQTMGGKGKRRILMFFYQRQQKQGENPARKNTKTRFLATLRKGGEGKRKFCQGKRL